MNIFLKSQTLSNIWNTSSKWINFPSQSYSWSWSVFGKQNACIHWLALPGKHIFLQKLIPACGVAKGFEKKNSNSHTFTASLTTTIFSPLNKISHEPQCFSDFSTVWPQQKPTYLKVATPGHKGIVTREGCHKETQDLFHNTWIEDLQSRGGGPACETSNLI